MDEKRLSSMLEFKPNLNSNNYPNDPNTWPLSKVGNNFLLAWSFSCKSKISIEKGGACTKVVS